MIRNSKIIVITGAESTGKSRLTAQLAEHYKMPYIPELAREYVENRNGKYSYSDVEKIAKQQIECLEVFLENENDIIFIDTWLIITKIWFEVAFQKKPEWLLKKIKEIKIDLFLVCDIDLPWIPDPVRENGGKNRIILHKKYIETLEYFKFEYKIVSGKGEDRFNKALKILSSQLKLETKN